jgi:hypothetical protein
MARVKQFEDGLDSLFSRRTAWLRTAIGKARPGPAPKFSHAKVKPRLHELCGIAKTILVKNRGKKEFEHVVEFRRRWHPKKGKGWGAKAKKESFKKWFDRKVHRSNFVYAFWSRDDCQYVGRTKNGKGRPQSYFDKIWFPSVTRIDVHAVRLASEVPKAECLAIDRFNPKHNANAASRPKYSKKCPICSAVRDIRHELEGIFRIR